MSELPGLFKIRASYKPTAEIEIFIGDKGQLFYSEEEKILRISDGVTLGGIPISSANLGSGDGIQGLTADEINQILFLNSGFDFVPQTDSQQDLGAADKRWRHIYVSGGTIFLGNDATISENPASGSIVLPAGSVMESANGTLEPIASVDLSQIDWNLALAGIDLGLEYATTSYVDGKIREAAIQGVVLENSEGNFPNQLSDLSDVGALNAVNGAFLQYNAAQGQWAANIIFAESFATVQLDLTTLQNIINNINNNITTIENSITEISTKIDTLPIEALSNVDISALESGSLLQYNGIVNKWQATNNIETTFGTLRLNGGAF